MPQKTQIVCWAEENYSLKLTLPTFASCEAGEIYQTNECPHEARTPEEAGGHLNGKKTHHYEERIKSK